MQWSKHIRTFEKYDDIDDEFDFADELSPKRYGPEDEGDSEISAAFDELADTIRKMIRNSGNQNFTVTVHDKDFVIEFVLEQDKKFSKFASLIGLMKKIHKDILVSYEPSVDLWYTKDKKPLITFDFYYKEGNSKKSFNFNDDLPF
jgi:hypothetical protein